MNNNILCWLLKPDQSELLVPWMDVLWSQPALLCDDALKLGTRVVVRTTVLEDDTSFP